MTGYAATIRWPAGQGLSAVAVVTVALTLAGSSALQSGSSLAKPLAGAAALKQAETAGIDIGGVIETVQHHVAPSKRDPSTLIASDRLYHAEFSREGMSLSLRGSRFGLGTASSELAARISRSSPGGWPGTQRAERTLRRA